MNPHILMTVYRRYESLKLNIDRIHTMLEEFGEVKPSLTLVWAQPEAAKQDFIYGFLERGEVSAIIERAKLPLEGESGGVTYPESNNLRLGLNFIKSRAQRADYAIVQTADLFPVHGTYKKIHQLMSSGATGVVYSWKDINGNTFNYCHTNFFAICMSEHYWPPLSDPQSPHVLEAQWMPFGILPGICRFHEADFYTTHEVEDLKGWLQTNG